MVDNCQFIGKLLNGGDQIKIDNIDFNTLNNGHWEIRIQKNSIFRTSVDQSIILIGPCFSLRKKECAIELLEEFGTIEELEENTKYLGGRWILIWKEYVITDFSSNHQLFYYRNSNEVIISSSLSLISRELKIQPCPARMREMDNLDFFPGPDTIYPDIQLLFSFQYFQNELIKTKGQNLIINDSNNDDLITEFIESTKVFLENIRRENYEILLPLTGGVDSRTNLAFLLNQNIVFGAYTTWYKGIKLHDVLIPKLLSWLCGNFEYRLIKPNEINKKKIDSYDFHTGFNCVEKDRLFYANNSYPIWGGSNSVIMLRGAGWAPFRGFYTLDMEEILSVDQRLQHVIEKLNFHGNFNAIASLGKWLSLIENVEIADWRLRYYIDQRLNSWDGSIEQSIQLTGFNSIQLVNSEIQYELLYSLFKNNISINRSNLIQRKIIKKLKPRLDYLPYNFSKKWTNRFEYLKRRLSQFCNYGNRKIMHAKRR
jgi:hypothetical protein